MFAWCLICFTFALWYSSSDAYRPKVFKKKIQVVTNNINKPLFIMIYFSLCCLCETLTSTLKFSVFSPLRCSSPGCSSTKCWPVLCQFVKASCWLLICFSRQCYGAWSERHFTGQVCVLFFFSMKLARLKKQGEINWLVSRHLVCSFMPAVNNLTSELLEAEKSNRRLERELRALRKRLGSTLVLRGSLQE